MRLLGRRPIVCLVSDRRRRPSSPGGEGAACDAVVDLAGAAGRAGVDIVQVRERGLTDRALLELVQRVVAALRGCVTRVVVNDRSDIALAAGAAGVHLKEGGPSPSRVRAIAPAGWLIGQSVHGRDDAWRAGQGGGLDYLICGTVFESVSKPGRTPLGPDGLAAVVRATGLPVLAIGGVGPGNAARVAETGAAGVAAIGLFAESGGCAGPVDVAERVAALRSAFDKGWGLV